MKTASIILLIFLLSTVGKSLAQSTIIPVVVVIGQAEDCPTITGLEKKSSIVKVYPNPAEHSLIIKTALSNGKIQLMDMHGRQVIGQQINSFINQIDISDLKPGIYLLRLKHQHGDEYVKIKIQ